MGGVEFLSGIVKPRLRPLLRTRLFLLFDPWVRNAIFDALQNTIRRGEYVREFTDMPVTCFDTETSLIRPGMLAPALVCVSYQSDGGAAQLLDASAAEMWMGEALLSGANTICGHNVSYDMAVLCERFPHLRPAVFRAYAEDRVTDTMIRQKLLDIAAGTYRGRMGDKGMWIVQNYGLLDLTKRFTDMPFKKEGFRLFYGLFQGLSLGEWPTRAREVQARGRGFLEGSPDAELSHLRDCLGDWKKFETELRGMVAASPEEVTTYPLDDARATYLIYQAQEAHKSFLADQYRQARAAWALHLSSAWGMRTCPEGVEALRQATAEAHKKAEAELQEAELIKQDGVRDTKRAKLRMVGVCEEEDLPLRRTAGHADPEGKCKGRDGTILEPGSDECVEHVSLDADACAATGDHLLELYAEASTLKKVLSNDVEMLKRGREWPISPTYGMAETGRGTCSKPNIQNVGKREGIRECFIPRPGHVFFAADFPALEAYTWAQCCVSWLGQSKLAEALNGGLDPHLLMASEILGISYTDAKTRYEAGETEVADVRQLSKVANFGFPGGMGAPKLLVSAIKQLKKEVVERLGLDLERMIELKEQWRTTWPEADPYFARIKSLGPAYPERYTATVESLFTHRIRGGATYCAASNNGFQALGADCAKNAAWLICCAQYNDPASPMFNSRTVAFVHDEFVGETQDTPQAHDVAHELARLMVAGANVYLPDVPIPLKKMKPLLMRRWSKLAEPQNDSTGRLIPWEAAA